MGYEYSEKNEIEMSKFHDWYFRKGEVPSKGGGYNEMDFGSLRIQIVFWYWRKFIK